MKLNLKRNIDAAVQKVIDRWRKLQAEDLVGEPVDLGPFGLPGPAETALAEADHSYRSARTLLDKSALWLEGLVQEVQGADTIDQTQKNELVERLRQEYMQTAAEHIKAARGRLSEVVAEQEAAIQGAAPQPEKLDPMAEVAQWLRLGELVEDLVTDFRIMRHPDEILQETKDRLAAAFARGNVAEAAAVRRAARRALSVSDSPAARPALQAIEREHAAGLRSYNEANEDPAAETARNVIRAAHRVYVQHDRAGGFPMAQKLANAGHPVGMFAGFPPVETAALAGPSGPAKLRSSKLESSARS
jgi:molybdenum-dependent DNA-binding transcriptional regulator ModE